MVVGVGAQRSRRSEEPLGRSGDHWGQFDQADGPGTSEAGEGAGRGGGAGLARSGPLPPERRPERAGTPGNRGAGAGSILYIYLIFNNLKKKEEEESHPHPIPRSGSSGSS